MNVIIIEDEHLAVKNLITIFSEIGEINVVAAFEPIAESVEWFESHVHPDLVFMDIHLADGSAFEIFERTSVACPVIFTTAYDEYAIKAFKVNSIDYLLKPIDRKAVLQALNKYRSLVNSGNVNEEVKKIALLFSKTPVYRKNFLIPAKSDKLIPLSVDKAAFFFIDIGITYVYTS
jgi:two-component system LytT family response regulator